MPQPAPSIFGTDASSLTGRTSGQKFHRMPSAQLQSQRLQTPATPAPLPPPPRPQKPTVSFGPQAALGGLAADGGGLLRGASSGLGSVGPQTVTQQPPASAQPAAAQPSAAQPAAAQPASVQPAAPPDPFSLPAVQHSNSRFVRPLNWADRGEEAMGYLGDAQQYLGDAGLAMAAPTLAAAGAHAVKSAPAALSAAYRGATLANTGTGLLNAGRSLPGAVRAVPGAVKSLSGLSQARAMPLSGLTGLLKSPVMQGFGKILGKVNPITNAVYGAYALGDVGRSAYNLYNGTESLDQIQNDAMNRGYLGNVGHNLNRPGQAAIALGHGAVAAPMELAQAHARAAALNMQVRDQQAARQQTNTQAFNSGSMTPQQHVDHWDRMRKLPLATQAKIVQDSAQSRAAASLLRGPSPEPARPYVNHGF